MKNIPEKIYLQIPEGSNDIDDFNEFYPGEMTWAAERINKDDIEYERRKVADLKNTVLPIFEVSESAMKMIEEVSKHYETGYRIYADDDIVKQQMLAAWNASREIINLIKKHLH